MELLKALGLCVTVCALLLALKTHGRAEMACLASIAFTALMLLWVLKSISPAVAEMRALLDGAGVGGETAALVFKVTGIALVSEFACQLCRDAGEGALGAKAALAGKVSVLLLALPLLKSLCGMVLELLP